MERRKAMKKRLLCFLTILAIMVSFVPNAMAKEHDPYAGIFFKDFDEITDEDWKLGGYDCLANFRDAWLVFRDVNFGTESPVRVLLDVGFAMPQVYRLEFRLDAPDGPMILKTEFEDTGWAITLQERLLDAPVTGKHDLYVVNPTTGTANLQSIRFIEPPPKLEVFPEYPLKDAYEDIADSKFREKINLVSALGLIDPYKQGLYGPDLALTRGEFARAIYKLMSEEKEDFKLKEKPFDDVNVDDKFAQAVDYLKKEKIILGNDDNTFRPYEIISVNDAVVMICRMLKLEPIINVQGGYIDGYLAVAQEEGLMKGVDVTSRLQRGTFAQIIYNAINADYLDLVKMNLNKSFEYQMVPGILSELKGIYRSDIYIEETTYTGIYSPESSLGSKQVRSGKDIYNTGDSGAEAYIGMTCECYWQDVDGERNIIYLFPKNEDKTYLANSWDGNEIDFSDGQLTILDVNGKTIKKDLSDFAILHNGKSLDVPLEKAIKATIAGIPTDDPDIDEVEGEFRGSVRIIESEKNPIIFIEQYRDIYIQGFDKINMAIYNKLTNDVIEIGDNEFALSLNSETTTSDHITVGQTGSYYESVNKSGKKIIRLLVNDKTLTGTVTKKTSDKITIDGVEYNAGDTLPTGIQLGVESTFYFNEYGEIIYAGLINMSGFNTGIYLGYKDASDEEKFLVKIANQEGEVVSYECAEYVTLDSVKVRRGSDIAQGLNGFIGLDNIDTGSVILYRINADNQITVLDTYDAGPQATTVKSKNNKLQRVTTESANYYYKKASNLLLQSSVGVYAVDPNGTLIKHISEEDSDKYVFDTVTNLSAGRASSLILYTTHEDSFFNNILVLKNNAMFGSVTDPFIFGTKTEAVNEDDVHGYYISGYGNEGTYDFFVTDDEIQNNPESVGAFITNVETGDWVDVRTNSNGVVVEGRIICKYNGSGEISNGLNGTVLLNSTTSTSGSAYRYILGTVAGIEGNLIRVDTTNTTDEYIDLGADNIALWGRKDTSKGPAISYKKGVGKENIMLGAQVLIYVENERTNQILVKSL